MDTPKPKKKQSNVPLFILWVVLFPLVAIGLIAYLAYTDRMKEHMQGEFERGKRLEQRR